MKRLYIYEFVNKRTKKTKNLTDYMDTLLENF